MWTGETFIREPAFTWTTTEVCSWDCSMMKWRLVDLLIWGEFLNRGRQNSYVSAIWQNTYTNALEIRVASESISATSTWPLWSHLHPVELHASSLLHFCLVDYSSSRSEASRLKCCITCISITEMILTEWYRAGLGVLYERKASWQGSVLAQAQWFSHKPCTRGSGLTDFVIAAAGQDNRLNKNIVRYAAMLTTNILLSLHHDRQKQITDKNSVTNENIVNSSASAFGIHYLDNLQRQTSLKLSWTIFIGRRLLNSAPSGMGWDKDSWLCLRRELRLSPHHNKHTCSFSEVSMLADVYTSRPWCTHHAYLVATPTTLQNVHS